MDAQVQKIIERNAKVEADKAWETSWTRRLSIAVITYVLALIFMSVVGLGPAPLGALVPTGGYLLSTLSMPFLKKVWIEKLYKAEQA